MIRIALLCLAIAGCTSTPTTYGSAEKMAADRREDAVKRMQDEFNRATGDAY